MKAENKIQQECVQWFRNEYCRIGCDPKYVIFSVPNETKDMKELMTKKQTGLKSGVSDLIVVLRSQVLFLECKDDKGRQSENQIKFQAEVQSLYHHYHVFRTLEEFQRIIFTYL